MFCRQCGTAIGDGALFCPGCGQAVLRATGDLGAAAGVDVTPAEAAAPSSYRPDVLTEPTAVDLATMPTQPLPAVTPPTALAAPPLETPATPRRSHAALWATLAVCGVIVLAGAAAFLYFSGSLKSFGIAPPSTTTSSTAGKKATGSGKSDTSTGKGDSGGESAGTGDAADTLSEAQSFDLLQEHYGALWDLHAEIGLANPDGTYGGTGFAYDVFNPKIGSPDRDVRVALNAQCQDLADEISQARARLADALVDDAYADQKDGLLGLYDLLTARVSAMLGAATIAVDSPDEASWRPTLSPASVDARKNFEATYPNWEPVRQ